MLAFDPLLNEVRDFDLWRGDVFVAGGNTFLVTCPDDNCRVPLSIVGEDGRSRSIADYEDELCASGAVPEMVCHIGAWRDES